MSYPFSALVGLADLKLALQLSAIDPRLSVLLRGDKGAGKSTAARGLAELLPPGAPFVNLPIGTTDDRLLGGLDIDLTLKGLPTLKPGLVAQAHGGVLYVDEVNLLADHLADALLDSAASGMLIVERDGFSASHAAEFILLGSMNPEEGSLRPQLLDRFALASDVEAPMDVSVRAEVLDRRSAFDAEPTAFRLAWHDAQLALAARLATARTALLRTVVPPGLSGVIAARIVEHRVRSLRADLAVLRASRACAALLGDATVEVRHIDTVLPLALAHRLPAGSPPPRPPTPPAPPAHPPEPPSGSSPPHASQQVTERVFEPLPVPSPRIVVEAGGDRSGTSPSNRGTYLGPQIATRRAERPSALALRDTIVHAIGRSGALNVEAVDLHEPVRARRRATRFIMVVDSSGSHAALERMRLVKGVATGLLEVSQGRHDEVVVIACRGPLAEVLLQPTSSYADAARALEYLPTGGRTPLAHGLELAAGYVTDDALVIVITDGHPNVPTRSEDAWADARDAARALGCPALVIDTEDPRSATGRPRELADALGGTCTRLDDLQASQVLTVIREVS